MSTRIAPSERFAVLAVLAAIALTSVDVGAVVEIAETTLKASHVLFAVGLVLATVAMLQAGRLPPLSRSAISVLVAIGALMLTQVLSFLGGWPGLVDAAGRVGVMIGGALVPTLAILFTITSRERFTQAVSVFLAAQLAFAVFGIYQLLAESLGLPNPVTEIGIVAGATRISSFSLEPGYYAAFSASALPLATYLLITGRRIGPVAPWLLWGTLVGVLAVANSRAGYLLGFVAVLATVAAVTLGGILRRPALRRVAGGAATAAVLALAVSLAAGIEIRQVVGSQVENTVNVKSRDDCAGPDNNACVSNSVRTETYRVGWEIFTDHPVVGIGDGRAAEELPRYGIDTFEGREEATLQSVLLEVGVETGIVGLLGLTFLLWRLVVVSLRGGSANGAGETEDFEWPARMLMAGALLMLVVGGLIIMWLWDVRVWSLVGLGLAGLTVAGTPAAERS